MSSAPEPARRRWYAIVAGAVMLAALGQAVALNWVCDDAFVSFRYAENLIEGRGLVFNEGERVEGMTNFAWTLWIAFGMALGATPEGWASLWSLAAYALALALLAAWGRDMNQHEGRPKTLLPVALIVGAAHPDWQIWATGGLESSAFTTCVFAGHLLIARGFTAARPASARAAGGVMALAALLRPDGVAFAFGGAVVLAFMGAADAQARRRSMLRYLLVFGLIWGVSTALRVGYYGDFFPNTYYAKSGGGAWWSQGLSYLGLYVERYWVLLPFVVLAPLLAWRDSDTLRDPGVAQAVSAACYVLGYTLYVTRVGGGFMFARFLIPITPFLALCCALVLRRIQHPQLAPLAALSIALGLLVSRSPVGDGPRHGIADERLYWTWPGRTEQLDASAEGLRRALEGLPVVMAHPGAHCRIIYRSKVPVSIDVEGGLTDPVVAHSKVRQRGRPGHEKIADYAYLQERGVHFVAGKGSADMLGLLEHVPAMPMMLNGFPVWIIRWDPQLMQALRQRGLQVPDFDVQLEIWAEQFERLPAADARQLADQLERFYFGHTDDPRAKLFAPRFDDLHGG